MTGRVFVGLSGGVDSAVSAALLKQDGYEVTGVFIKIWQPEFIECTWREDRLDAMRVAAALGIPFREVDLSAEYKKEVIDPMIASYGKGITPNPDVLCNERIKFGAFSAWAQSEGAAYVATGHYARVESGRLYRALDSAKDQSYFLHRVSSEELSRAIFPIGGLHKRDVRRLAEKHRLPVSKKPDSQGLCFVGDVSIEDFLGRFMSLDSGDVIDPAGKAIGKHAGAARYTIGQRHGFEIHASSASQAPRYVSAIDTRHNTITVSENRTDAEVRAAHVDDMHWISAAAGTPERVSVQCRYHEEPVGATFRREGTSAVFEFEKPHLCASGQSLVAYMGSECLGGGPIVSTGR